MDIPSFRFPVRLVNPIANKLLNMNPEYLFLNNHIKIIPYILRDEFFGDYYCILDYSVGEDYNLFKVFTWDEVAWGAINECILLNKSVTDMFLKINIFEKNIKNNLKIRIGSSLSDQNSYIWNLSTSSNDIRSTNIPMRFQFDCSETPSSLQQVSMRSITNYNVGY